MTEVKMLWSEDLELPICKYCCSGMLCSCGASGAERCNFCTEGCQCGYSAVEEGSVCECECTCGENNEDGDCPDCCICDYPLKSDLPDYCNCECECPECECSCECPVVVIDADTYNEWVRKTCYVCDPECLDDKHLQESNATPDFVTNNQRCLVEIGQYEFLIKTLPPYVISNQFSGPTFMGIPMLHGGDVRKVKSFNRLKVVQDGYKGLIRFSNSVHIPVLRKDGTVWMSLTPMEALSQRPGVEKANGNVLVGGLGMGWLTQKILEKPNVKHVVQVYLGALYDRHFEELRKKYPKKCWDGGKRVLKMRRIRKKISEKVLGMGASGY